jgi:hypothetical protein
VDPAGFVEREGGEDLALGWGDLGALPEGAGGAGEGAQVQALQFVTGRWPGLCGGGLGDADEQQGQPAQRQAGPDAFLAAVIGRPRVDELPPSAKPNPW